MQVLNTILVPQSSFNRKKHHDWSPFNTLHLRVRGDGRPWMVNVAAETYFSHQKDDIYCYFLYTRGGPYWQEVKVGPGQAENATVAGPSRASLLPLFPDPLLQVLPLESREGAGRPAPTLGGQGGTETLFHPPAQSAHATLVKVQILVFFQVNTVGLTLGDKTDGPFQLEIDFIGVCKDYAHTEEFAYEAYKRNPEV